MTIHNSRGLCLPDKHSTYGKTGLTHTVYGKTVLKTRYDKTGLTSYICLPDKTHRMTRQDSWLYDKTVLKTR